MCLAAAGPGAAERPRAPLSPQLAVDRAPVETRDVDLVFCLDVSGSMTTPFGNGTRYDGAMNALNEFLTYRKGDSFGLLVFGDDNLQWVPLTTDVSAFACAPPFLRPENLPNWFRGGTFIGKALRESEKLLLAADEGDPERKPRRQG